MSSYLIVAITLAYCIVRLMTLAYSCLHVKRDQVYTFLHGIVLTRVISEIGLAWFRYKRGLHKKERVGRTHGHFSIHGPSLPRIIFQSASLVELDRSDAASQPGVRTRISMTDRETGEWAAS